MSQGHYEDRVDHGGPTNPGRDIRALRRSRIASRRGMKRTFYISTSWANRAQAAEVANYLQSRGLRWSDNHNWPVTSSSTNLDASAKSLWAYKNLQAAVSADLFILLLCEPLTPGCHAELGARASHGKES
jgi:hypothetical protein